MISIQVVNPDKQPMCIDVKSLKWNKTTKDNEFTASWLEEKFTLNGALDEESQLTGRCKIISVAGIECTGDFVAGNLTGEATLINHISNEIFKGKFIQGVAIYCSEYSKNNQIIYQNQSLDKGQLVYVKDHRTDEGVYTGSWHQGEPHGKGEFKYNDNAKYRGSWENGLYKGEGTYTQSFPDVNNLCKLDYEGSWEDDEPIDGKLKCLFNRSTYPLTTLEGDICLSERSFKGHYIIDGQKKSIEVKLDKISRWDDSKYPDFWFLDDQKGEFRLGDSLSYRGRLHHLLPYGKGKLTLKLKDREHNESVIKNIGNIPYYINQFIVDGDLKFKTSKFNKYRSNGSFNIDQNQSFSVLGNDLNGRRIDCTLISNHDPKMVFRYNVSGTIEDKSSEAKFQKYSGELIFRNCSFIPHGKGTMIDSNGMLYDGEWVEGKFKDTTAPDPTLAPAPETPSKEESESCSIQ